jgi:hypothetical protein
MKSIKAIAAVTPDRSKKFYFMASVHPTRGPAMIIYADSQQPGVQTPQELIVRLPKTIDCEEAYLSLLEVVVYHDGSDSPLIRISADCVGPDVSNGCTSHFLRDVLLERRARQGSGESFRERVEFRHIYPIKVNQPELDAIRLRLSAPDNESLASISRVRCVLELSYDDHRRGARRERGYLSLKIE